jgi:hypothetical protein
MQKLRLKVARLWEWFIGNDYRPELYYMRGPGPAYKKKYGGDFPRSADIFSASTKVSPDAPRL